MVSWHARIFRVLHRRHVMKTGMVSALAFFSVLGAVGCGGAAEGADPAAAPKDEAPTTFERTIVHVASGKATVTTEKIDANEQLVRAAAMKEPTARANDGVGTTSSALIQV